MRASVVAIAMVLVAGIMVGCTEAQRPQADKNAPATQKAEEDWQPEAAKDPHANCDHDSHDHASEKKDVKKADHAGHDHANEKKEEKKSDHDTHDHSGHTH